MKLWVLTIFRVQSKLEALVKRVDKQIADIALDLTGNTMELYNSILQWNDILRRLVNLRVIGDRLRTALSDEEYDIMWQFLKGATMEEIALGAHMGHSTVLRKIQSGVYKCVRTLSKLGFNERRLEEEYGEIMLIRKTMGRIERNIKVEKKADKRIEEKEVEAGEVTHLVSAEASPAFSSNFF